MNIRAQLLVEHSKRNTERIRKFIGNDEPKLAILMEYFFKNEFQVSQRAVMVVSDVFDHSPELITPFTHRLIENLIQGPYHVAIKRSTIRILQFIEIPEEKISALFDHCLNNVVSVEEPIAIKAFSMIVLLNICESFPELKHEVIPVLEIELERNKSAGVINRGKKILKALLKL
ncbi:MAG: hypothetical protein ACJAV5_001055 [Vicingaceae bacterium]|jgi:hypothetical protein